MNLIALELFTDAVCPRQQIQDVGGRFQIKKPRRLLTGNLAAAQNMLAEDGKFLMIARVNRFRYHG